MVVDRPQKMEWNGVAVAGNYAFIVRSFGRVTVTGTCQSRGGFRFEEKSNYGSYFFYHYTRLIMIRVRHRNKLNKRER